MHDSPSLNETDLDVVMHVIEGANPHWLPARLTTIAGCVEQCIRRPGAEVHYESLARHLNALSTSACSHGLNELGMQATELEKSLHAFIRDGIGGSERFLRIAGEVRAFLARAADPWKPDPALPRATPAAGGTERPDRLIYLVHDNALVAKDIAWQLRNFGYEVLVIGELARLREHIDARLPGAVVMDLGFPSGILAGAREVARIKADGDRHFGAIFISAFGNFEARLAAVRAGADGYFSKPLDMVALVDRLDALLSHEEVTPYRILIVEGGLNSAQFHANALAGAGMEVKVLGKVSDLLHALDEFRPELVLMDVRMPGCGGVDLARLIRQDIMYLDVPIVFLSEEAGIDKQLMAIESGGDDFLIRPIAPAHLVSALNCRARRYRALRGLIMRDSLTGLLNHSAIKEHLMREIARARRGAMPLTLTMVDIDLFKQINDSYGHPVGDQVIRALSRMLQQRLRRGDIVGRYGGEEFAVIMPGTPASAAIGVLDQIRESFGQIRHYAETRDFTATFSAGVAELAPEINAETLFRLADAALYRAKHDGRNCIRG